MKPQLYLLAFLILLPLFAYSGTIEGFIRDEQGQELPFATIFIKGTTQGTSSNANGYYQLTLPDGKHTLVARYMGYEQAEYTVTVSGNTSYKHNFSLKEQSLSMEEVVVRANAEDPAYRIIREAIKKRKYHREQINAFQTGIYLKGVLRSRQAPTKIFGETVDMEGVDSNGKGVLYLCEEIADYYTNGKKERTIIHSVKESGDPNGVGFGQMPEVISFYENNIMLSPNTTPRGLVSPIADGALGYYRYKLLGEYMENGQMIYKISITPKRKYEPLFSGTLYIADQDWAIHSLSLLATQKSGLEMFDTLRLDQVYLPIKKDLWVIKNQVMYPTISMLGFNLTGNFVTVYNNQEVDPAFPEDFFDSKIIGEYDANANKTDSSFWADKRPLKLEEDEVKDYVIKDSLRELRESPEYRDSVRKQYNKITPGNILYSGIYQTGKENKYKFLSRSLLGTVSYNTVEGLVVAPKFTFINYLDSSYSLRTRIAPRYGFSNTHFNAIGSISLVYNSKDWISKNWGITAEGGKYVFQYNPSNPITPFLNSLSTLLFGSNHMKIHERWTAGLGVERNQGNGLQWNAKLSFQRRLPLYNTIDYSWASSSRLAENYTSNTPANQGTAPFEVHNAMIASAGISWQAGYTYTQYPSYKYPHGSDWPVFSLSYQKGIKSILDSKTDFDRWRFSVKDAVNLNLLGSFSYKLATGGMLNDNYAALQDLNQIDGNQIIYEDDYLQRFQLAPYYLFANSKKIYGEAHVEYYLKGLITNKIPILRQAKWYMILGTNSYYAGKDLYYAEAFIGADNLGFKVFRMIRVDFLTSWDSYRKQCWGFRIGLRPNGVVRVDAANEGEW